MRNLSMLMVTGFLSGVVGGFVYRFITRVLRKKKETLTKPKPFPPGTKFRVRLREDGNAEMLVAVRPDGIQYIATNVTDPETGEIRSYHLLLRPGTMAHINQMLVDCISDLLAEQKKERQDVPIQAH